VATTPTIVDFLTEMGFRMDFEYILRGYMFRKGRMKITVSKIFKVSDFIFVFFFVYLHFNDLCNTRFVFSTDDGSW